jgi:hypothetical protein
MRFGAGVNDLYQLSVSYSSKWIRNLMESALPFRGQPVSSEASTVSVNAAGRRAITLRDYQYYFGYSDPEPTTVELNNNIFFLKRKTLAPSLLVGGITLVHETLDQVRSPRKSWIYVPGQRRLRSTPNLNHNTPDIATNSLRTNGQVDMINNAPNYYNWELTGKQEMYIPYNSYLLHST